MVDWKRVANPPQPGDVQQDPRKVCVGSLFLWSHIFIFATSTLHVFGIVNFLSIPMVWAFYPETANRTLEEMDLLFASKSPFVWDEERHFQKLKAELASGKKASELVKGVGTPSIDDAKGLEVSGEK